VIGYQEHGAMFELHYDGDWSDLDQVTLHLTAEQDGERKDANQAFEVIDGRRLAEMTDAMYDLGPVYIQLNFHREPSDQGSTTVELETGYDHLFPWMLWPYGNSGLSKSRANFPNPEHPEAYDLQPTSDDLPDGLGHPVSSPCSGKIYQSSTLPRDDGKVYHNMWIYCPYTGFYVQLGHMDPQLTAGGAVDTNTVVGYVSDETGWPHTHTTARRPTTPPRMSQITDNSTFVDLFNPHIQMGGAELPYGYWLPEALPQHVKSLVESGVFAAAYNTPRYMLSIP
jgi:hypothetical protein